MLDLLSSYRRIVFGSVFLLCFLLVIVFRDENVVVKYTTFFTTEETTINSSGYLVYSSKCRIPDLDPFNQHAKKFLHPEKYTRCRKLDLLTYVSKSDNIATLHVDNEIVPSYTKNGVSCCYSYVTRQGNKQNPDDGIRISKCLPFDDNVTMSEEIVTVKCKDAKTKRNLYENVHVAIIVKRDTKEKLELLKNSTRNPISVLFVGVDSISRLNFIRSLPATYEYVEKKGWISLKGYNKIDDNTFPNVMAILTGYNQTHAYSVCDPKKLNQLDQCPILWYNFRKLGYVTAYAEDEAWINTFNYRKKGFTKPPTDYYFRPYMQATEKLKIVRKDGMNYCTGPETAGERILNVAKEFAMTFKDDAKFGFFWMNTFSHNEINSPTGMDKKIKGFLEDLSNSGVLENSVLVFLSDHGIRFGEIRYTPTGWLEERLPFIYISIPEKVKEKYPKEYTNLKNNALKLTNPYDLHMTLQDILVMSGFNYTIRPSNACPNCTSLFREIQFERSCADAAIEQHWCTCSGYKKINKSSPIVKVASTYIVNEIREIIHAKRSDSKCAKYSLDYIVTSSISQSLSYLNNTYLLLVIQTIPKAIFEATVLIENSANSSGDPNFSLQGGISRLDRYSSHSKCIDDAYLKKFCYCR